MRTHLALPVLSNSSLSTLSCLLTASLLSGNAVAQEYNLFRLVEDDADRLGAAIALSPVTEMDELYPDVIVGAPAHSAGGVDSGRVFFYGGEDGLPRLTLDGATGDQFGTAITVGDDWNLDGTLDIVIGAPQGGEPCSRFGYVRIVSGTDGAELLTIAGSEACSLFGAAVALIGDVDGDGFSEIAVGAPRHLGSGAVFVVSVFQPGAPLSGMVAPFQDSLLGFSVSAFADYDGDEVPDYIVGAPDSPFAAPLAGSAFLLSGADSSVLRQWHGSVARDHFGASVAAVDINGDGLPEAIIGAPQATGNSNTGPGEVRVISGADGHAPLTTLVGGASDSRFGYSLASAGDIDGDGDEELLIGAPTAAGGGRAEVWDILPNTPLQQITGLQPTEGVGGSIAGGQDINRDGVMDFATGAADAGRVRVVSSAPLSFAADVHTISMSKGGVMTAELDAGPEWAGYAYYVLGSATGTVPGTFMVNAHVPLNWGPYFCELFVYPNDGPFKNNLGSLSPEGKATMQLVVGAGSLDAPYLGFQMKHSFIVFNPGDGAAPVKFVGKETAPLTIVE